MLHVSAITASIKQFLHNSSQEYTNNLQRKVNHNNSHVQTLLKIIQLRDHFMINTTFSYVLNHSTHKKRGHIFFFVVYFPLYILVKNLPDDGRNG